MARGLVVGGGILGTMHAVYLRQAGFEVVQLEAQRQPRGASVRNFGLIWVGGRRSGDELAAAIRSRQRWEELGAEVPGIGFRAGGSLTVALEPAELKVMEDWVGLAEADAEDRRIELLGRDEVARVNPAVRGDVLGALWCRRDAIVEPRATLGALRAHLEAGGGYRFEGECRVVSVDPGVAVDQRGRRWAGDVIVAATGADPLNLVGAEMATTAPPVRPVRLQMLQTEPYSERLSTSLADADSMRYYPAYRAAALDALPPQSPLAAREHLQLLVAQRADGGLTIGDTHLYDEPFDFDLDEAPYQDLLARAGRILGQAVPPVARRWDGVYSQCLDAEQLCYRAEVRPGVWVVTGPGGRGMTCSPVIAEQTLAAAGIPWPR